MEDLLDGLDNIPEIMQQLQSSPTRGRQKVRSTQSFNVTAAMNPDNDNIVAEKFSLQADKVLKQLSDLRTSRIKKPRTVDQLASEALPQFDALLEKAGDADVFRQYDVLRRGKITYDDFHSIVVSCNTGFSKKESYALAHELDKSKTGLIRYNQIIDSLKNLDAKVAFDKQDPSRRASSAVDSVPQSRPASASGYSDAYSKSRNDSAAIRPSTTPNEAPMFPSDIIRVEDLEPSYPPSPIKTRQTQRDEAEQGRMVRGRYNSKYFGSNMTGVFDHDTARRERARSAPPVRFQGPSTAEGAIAKELSRRNQSTNRVIRNHDYGNRKAALNKSAAEKKKTTPEFKGTDPSSNSLMKYLKSGGRNDSKARGKPAKAKSEAEKFNAKDFFSAAERQKRAADKERVRREEAKDLESRATKVRVNSIISQTKGNLKPLQFQLLKRDKSRSGTVTRSEFDNTMKYLGIVMPKTDVDALFDAHSHTVQSTSRVAASIDYKQPVLHVDSFIHGLRLRGSAPIFSHLANDDGEAELPRTRYGHAVHHGNQRRHDNSKNNAESNEIKNSTISTLPEKAVVTPLERERARIVRKVMESNSDPTASKSRAQFLKNASLNGGKVKPEELIEQLNRDGANISPTEYDLLTTPLHPLPDGSFSVAEFSTMMTEEGKHLHNYGDLGRLSIGLSAGSHSNAPNSSCPEYTSNAAANSSRDDVILGRKYLGSTQHALYNHAAGFARDKQDRKELTKDKVSWSKVVSAVRSSKENLEKVMNGRAVRGKTDAQIDFSKPLTTQQLSRALSSAGVRLSTTDVDLLKAHCNAVESQGAGADVSLEAVCKSLGMNSAQDPKRGKVLVVPDMDIQDNFGIYGASHSSIMATPTFRSSMFDAPDTTDKSWSNRKRHYPQKNLSSASSFWNMSHTASVDLMPHPRTVFRGSMVHDNGSWNGVWPPNMTDAAHKASNNMSISEIRRDMFSPYGRGSGVENRSGRSQRRAGSAPPALTRKSLSEFVSGESESTARDPYRTPVSSSYKAAPTNDSFASVPSVAPEPAAAPTVAPVVSQPPRPVVRPADVRAPPPPSDVRDVSAAVSRWANKSLAELISGKSLGAPPTSNGETN